MTGATGRRLGRTDIEVSAVAMGCWAIVGDLTWGPQKQEDAIAAIRTALDCGINFFDTAEGYGDGYSEELLGQVLGSVRDRVIIGTKVSGRHARSRALLAEACENSLRRLRADYIDVYQLHWPVRGVPIAEVAGGLERLRQAGKIRCFGVSNFGKGDLTDLLACGRCEVNQLPYSLLWRAIEPEILPYCCEHRISVTAYSPLMQGLLTGKFKSADDVPEGRARTRLFSGQRKHVRHGEPGCEEETFAAIRDIAEIAEGIGRPLGEVALAWVLHQPGVDSVLVGARNPTQMRQNARAAELALTPDVVARLSEATDALKARLGSNPDMWESDSRYR